MKKSGIIKYTLYSTFSDMKSFDQNESLGDIKSNSCFYDNSVQGTHLWDE